MLLHRETSKDAELLVLRHENAVLRRQLLGTVRYQAAGRLWPATLSSSETATPNTPSFDAVSQSEDIEIYYVAWRMDTVRWRCLPRDIRLSSLGLIWVHSLQIRTEPGQ